MYSAFVWRADSPDHDELRCVLFLINGTVVEDHLREQVASTPLGTVRSSLLSSADLGENTKSSSWCGKVRQPWGSQLGDTLVRSRERPMRYGRACWLPP